MNSTCSLCGNRAVILIREEQIYLCEQHLESRILDYVRAVLEMLASQERSVKIAVAASGGKDSTVCLYVLYLLKEEYSLDLMAIAVDEGIEGFRDVKLKKLVKLSQSLDLDINIVSFKEFFGATLDDMVKLSLRKGFMYKPCTICGVLRRYLLNKVARELEVDYLATGHNFDDEAQSILMNILKNSMDKLTRGGPITTIKHEKFVPRLKPLYYCTEKEIATYAHIRHFNIPLVDCPYLFFNERRVLRRWLNRIELLNPGAKRRLILLRDKLSSNINRPSRSMNLCIRCGEPSSQDICKTCQILEYLGVV